MVRGLLMVTVLVTLTAAVCAADSGQDKMAAERYLSAVKAFADNVLAYGRDVYGPVRTPLFVDGINVDTLEPPVWKKNGERWILSNLASQQTLIRVLDGLSSATGDPKYRNAAIAAVKYAFDHLRDSSGLLYWGGHWCYDALGDRTVGENKVHEFKRHYPYYEFMWKIDPEATRRLIEAAWAAHILNWDNLDFNRHGSYGVDPTGVWDHDYKGGKVPFIGKGLTFMMSGTDLVYAAAMLSHFSGDPKPMVWAERLAQRYMDARHPKTKLGAENFSDPESRRVEKQFPEFGGRFTEATVVDLYGSRYTYCAACLLRLGETLGPKGRKFLQWGLEDLTARAKYGYDEETNSFWAMLIDGTKLTPEDRKHDGYVESRWLEKRPAGSSYFFAYALAYKLSKDKLMWDMVRKIGRGLDLGDFGEEPGRSTGINFSTTSNDPLLIFGLLELWEGTKSDSYLKLAQKIADNALETRVTNGFFVQSKDHVNAKFDDPLPLALLHLRAAILGLPQNPPAYWLSRGYLHCPYDGKGRTYDHAVIYSRLRGEPEP